MREGKGWGSLERLPTEGILVSGQDLGDKDGPKMKSLRGLFREWGLSSWYRKEQGYRVCVT